MVKVLRTIFVGGGAGVSHPGSVTGRNSASIQAFPVVSDLGAKVFGWEPLPWNVASPVDLSRPYRGACCAGASCSDGIGSVALRAR